MTCIYVDWFCIGGLTTYIYVRCFFSLRVLITYIYVVGYFVDFCGNGVCTIYLVTIIWCQYSCEPYLLFSRIFKYYFCNILPDPTVISTRPLLDCRRPLDTLPFIRLFLRLFVLCSCAEPLYFLSVRTRFSFNL